MSETIYVWEKKVKGSVPESVSSLFAALTGGLEKLERNFSPCGSRLREDTRETMGQIDVLEEMATSLAVAAIREQTGAVRERITRLQKLVDFESSESALIFAHYLGQYSGYIWLHGVDAGVEVGIWLSREGQSGFIGEKVVVATVESFAVGYDWVMANEEILAERIVELVAEVTA